MDIPEVGPPDGADHGRIRIGHAERAAALRALDEHFAAGRLDVEEYGARSSAAAGAVRAADLATLFDDLPAPGPPAPGSAPDPVVAERSVRPRHPARVPTPVVAMVLLPLFAVLALAVTAGPGAPVGLMFLPLVVVLLLGRPHRHGPRS